MIRAALDTPVQATLGSTLTRLAPGDGVRTVLVSTPSDLYLALDDSLDDGASVPATARFLIPGGSVWPLRARGPRPLLAAVSGSVDVTLLGSDAAAGAPAVSGGAGPVEITAAPATSQDDYAPTGWSTADSVRLAPTASVAITGLEARPAGTRVLIRNTSTFLAVLVCGSASSTAANRLQSLDPAETHVLLVPGDEVELVYDGTDSRWTIQRRVDVRRTTGTRRSWLGYTSTAPNGELRWVSAGGTNSTPVPTTSGTYAACRYRFLAATAASSAAVAGSGMAILRYLVGDGTGRGGFGFECGWALETVPDTAATAFVGLDGDINQHGNNDASTMTDCVGFSLDPADTTWHIQHNDSSGTCTRVDLGADYPRDTAPWFRGVLWADPNVAGRVSYAIWREDDATVAPVIGDLSTDLPSDTTALGAHHWLCNRASTASASISFDRLTIRSAA